LSAEITWRDHTESSNYTNCKYVRVSNPAKKNMTFYIFIFAH